LGALAEVLNASHDPKLRPLTVENGPTPVLVRGVERRCALAIDRNADEGRPAGLYGNRFAQSSAEAVQRAVRVLQPPTITNILAMAAVPGGYGEYSERDIRDVLVTAYTGFRAAVIESELAVPSTRIVVHSGHWGTGAFGGNRVLMAMLQILAARLAGLDRLVFHTVDADGRESWDDAVRWVGERVWAKGSETVDELVDRLVAMRFVWGQSDGN
jgi:hypothetical protein